MLNEKDFKKIISIVLIVILFILAAIIIKPIIISILFGVLLAYIFHPVYKLLQRKIQNKNLSALSVCTGIILIVLVPLAFIINALLGQIINIYIAIQKINILTILNKLLPSFVSTDISASLAASFNNFIPKIINSTINILSSFIMNLPMNLLKLFVVLFVFFFTLRDGDQIIAYLKSLSPLSKDTETQFFKHFKDITYSVLVGQIIIGIFQGLIAGIGYFIFGVPNALILTLITTLVGIIPLIGPWLVWVPIDIYLFASGRTGAGMGLLIYGLIIISWLDTIIRPLIVSRKTKINSAIVIIGMIGGLFVFGILGLILGPLILAYVLLVIEIYRKSKITKNIIFLKEE